ncbi:MAG: hypothetical protein WCK98_07650 [bacterium]
MKKFIFSPTKAISIALALALALPLAAFAEVVKSTIQVPLWGKSTTKTLKGVKFEANSEGCVVATNKTSEVRTVGINNPQLKALLNPGNMATECDLKGAVSIEAGNFGD